MIRKRLAGIKTILNAATRDARRKRAKARKSTQHAQMKFEIDQPYFSSPKDKEEFGRLLKELIKLDVETDHARIKESWIRYETQHIFKARASWLGRLARLTDNPRLKERFLRYERFLKNKRKQEKS